MKPRRYIRLLFNANKTYDRQVIEGVGRYLNTTQCNWDLFIEDDFRTQQASLGQWHGDGVIADLDDPNIEYKLSQLQLPVVGVGGSYNDPSLYPQIPYVATDNYQVMKLAFDHLKSLGLTQFAFYGLPRDPRYRWSEQREIAFRQLTHNEGFTCDVFHGHLTSSENWHQAQQSLCEWLKSLPQPVGVIAVTDSRARYLLQACEQLGFIVPERIAVVGIDNEEVARYLTRTSLSSIEQGCQQMGYKAAQILDQLLTEQLPANATPRLLIPPVQIHPRQSSDFHALHDPYVIQAMHFIRRHACQGIKVEQVLDYVGVSRSNLEARFKVERNHSIHQEIHSFKLEQACELLRATELPIAQISHYCGYPSLQYMYAVFKKNFQQTPKEFRDLRKHSLFSNRESSFKPIKMAVGN